MTCVVKIYKYLLAREVTPGDEEEVPGLNHERQKRQEEAGWATHTAPAGHRLTTALAPLCRGWSHPHLRPSTSSAPTLSLLFYFSSSRGPRFWIRRSSTLLLQVQILFQDDSLTGRNRLN